MSPRVRAHGRIAVNTADLAGIMGTGTGNRITIRDLEGFLHKTESQTTHEASKIRVGVARRDAPELDTSSFERRLIP